MPFFNIFWLLHKDDFRLLKFSKFTIIFNNDKFVYDLIKIRLNSFYFYN